MTLTLKKFFLYSFIVILYQVPMHNLFAYTRSVGSYLTDNIVWHALIDGGYYSLIAITTMIAIATFFKTFRVFIVSFFLAIFALYLLILLYEAFEDMSLLPS